MNEREYHYFEKFKWEQIEVYGGEKLLTQNDISELSAVYGVSSCLTGEMPQAENDILVSEDFLDMFGMTHDVVGSIITLVAENDE